MTVGRSTASALTSVSFHQRRTTCQKPGSIIITPLVIMRKPSYHYNEAAKYNRAEEHEKEAHHAYLAHGHGQLAVHHAAEAAKLHAEQCGSLVTPASTQAAGEKGAA